MQNIYQTFEFDRIKELVKEFAKTELAREYIANLEMIDDEALLEKALEELYEMDSIYLRFGPLPISSSANVLRLIDIAKKSGLFSPRDLYFIAEDVKTISLVNKYFTKITEGYIEITKKKDSFFDLSNLEKEIRRIITTSFTVSDNASPELKSIRTKLKKAEETLLTKSSSVSLSYSSYLSDGNPTIRDGHYVLPVKTSYKNKVMGIIYDVSDSGNTTFIEPLEIVQLNNEITSLRLQENEEVRKILKAITNLVLLQEHEVSTNNRIIAELDFLQSKVMFGVAHNCTLPIKDKKQVIELLDARHPLIDPKKVISNNYYLDEEKRIVIISGPNAGGKTVSLKTVGLLTMLYQSALPVTASKARFGYFKHIYIDIGDNQSLSDNLSTFSAHISQIAEITNVVKGKDLVLLDELGTGTDPKEGEAIALSTLEYLESKHPLCMISSHFGRLKEYAFNNPHIENSSMVFNEEKLLPTYIFKLGAPGKSYALEVASRFNLNPEIINQAKSLIQDNKDNDVSNLIEVLQKKVEETTFLEAELKKKEQIYLSQQIALENAQEALKKQKDTLLESVKNEKIKLIEEAKAEINEIIALMNKGDIKLHEAVELKSKLDALKDEEKVQDYNEEITVNDYVTVPALDINGTVTRINGKKATLLSEDGLSYEVEVKKLHKEEKNIIKKVNKAKTNYEDKINTTVGLELNLIGQRRDEAFANLTKYLDSARVKHLKTVRIIHGFGSGILRKMTHDYLKTQKDLSFRLGDAYEGGGGATVITFND